jgi:hypothetical protein
MEARDGVREHNVLRFPLPTKPANQWQPKLVGRHQDRTSYRVIKSVEIWARSLHAYYKLMTAGRERWPTRSQRGAGPAS